MNKNGGFSWGAQLVVCVPLLLAGVLLAVFL